MLDDAQTALQRALDATQLPQSADHDAIDAFLVGAYEQAWATRPGAPGNRRR
jgi:hypothetical protein